MGTREIEIPLYINGEPRHGREQVLERCAGGEELRLLLPAVTPTELDQVRAGARDLAALPLAEIVDFLAAVGARWADERYSVRREAFELAGLVTGYHERELSIDFGFIAGLLGRDSFLLPTLRAELGDTLALDGWAPRGGSQVRALPRGRVLHLLAGNVPGAEVLSLVRGCLTKNAALLKVASGNPVTPSFVVRAFRDVDPHHPVTRATSVLYWPHGAPAERAAFAAADAVCVWGGFEAVAAAWRQGRPGLPILEYGPKRSLLFIDRAAVEDAATCAGVAAGVARDVSLHEQQACHSPQLAFVERPAAERFCEALAGALAAEVERLPRGAATADAHAEIAHVRAMSELRGDRVYRPADGSTSFTIILADDAARARETPLGRTLYVVPVERLEEAVPFADSLTMVAGFSSAERLVALRDVLAARGVDRLCLAGQMSCFPVGFPHEGRYDLTRLVRFVGTDADLG